MFLNAIGNIRTALSAAFVQHCIRIVKARVRPSKIDPCIQLAVLLLKFDVNSVAGTEGWSPGARKLSHQNGRLIELISPVCAHRRIPLAGVLSS